MTYVGTPLKKTHLRDSYDAIVVGSGMGGLSVASILAQKGRQVLLLEQHNVIGGCTQSYARNGYEWNVGLHYIGDVHKPSTVTYKLFDYVTRGAIQWESMPQIYNRIVIGDREYPIPGGVGPYTAFLKGSFPGEEAAIDRYIELVFQVSRTSVGYFAEKAMAASDSAAFADDLRKDFLHYSDQTTLQVLQSLTQNAELIAVICGNYGDYGLEPGRSAFAMHAMLVRHYIGGASYPRGGASSLAKSIVPVIEAAGGQVVYSAEVDQLLLDGDRIAGVHLRSGQTIRADLVVSNAGFDNTFARLLPESAPGVAEMRRVSESIRPAGCGVGLNIGLKASAETLEFQGANYWTHPGPDFDANIARHKSDFKEPFPLNFITFPSSKDSSWAERFPGKATIEMFSVTDFDHFEQWSGSDWKRRGEDYEQRKQEIADRMFAELFRYVPQIEAHIDYYEVSTPVSYQHFLRRERGNFMGLEASPDRFRQAELRAETPIRGLYLSGQDVSTDGVIGALMGGVLAASRVLQTNVMEEIIAS